MKLLSTKTAFSVDRIFNNTKNRPQQVIFVTRYELERTDNEGIREFYLIRSSFDGAREDFPSVSDNDRRHIYLTLCIIRYMQNHIKPENSFAARLKILVNNFPKVNPSIMGFPPSWQEAPFWK